jgi:DNA-binding NtrC family response regulator
VDLQHLAGSPSENTEFDLTGSSFLINEVRDKIRKAARAGTDVLIWGETGTGKELVAAAIHKASPQSSGPYISINCGALDESLLMDTLFGHVKGAFTEARMERKGAFLSADGGTLLLDEIANASLKVQQALLRALSMRCIRPLGADADTAFNTRVVAATNVDLRECVRAGAFREDLYYRLAIISIETPPLRHHKEDIPQLAAFCIREAAANMGQSDVQVHLSHGALELIVAYDWPGNVRELKNCLTRAMAFAEGDLILPQHIMLEQDAFHAYGKAVPAQAPPGRLRAGELAEPLAALPLRKQKSLPEGAEQLPAKEQGDGVFRDTLKDGAQYSPMGEGHAAEYLWPAPPREIFTPVRLDKNAESDDVDHSANTTGNLPPDRLPEPAQGNAEEDCPAQDGQTPLPQPDTAYFSAASRAFPLRGAAADAALRSPFQHPESMARDRAEAIAAGSGSSTAASSVFTVPPDTPLPLGNVPLRGFSSAPADADIPLPLPGRAGKADTHRTVALAAGQKSFSGSSASLPFASPARASPYPGRQGNRSFAEPASPSSGHKHESERPGSGGMQPLDDLLLERLNERQSRCLQFLQINGEITRAQYESLAGQGICARTAQNDLKELVKLGILERLGAGPGVHYVLLRQEVDAWSGIN